MANKQLMLEVTPETNKAVRDFKLEYIKKTNTLPKSDKVYFSLVVQAGIEALKK